MSQYLIDRIKALPNVELHTNTEIVGLEGDGASGLTGAVFRCRRTGETHACQMRHLFLFIGAEPNTDWLGQSGLKLDPRGFVLTGDESLSSRPMKRITEPLGRMGAGVETVHRLSRLHPRSQRLVRRIRLVQRMRGIAAHYPEGDAAVRGPACVQASASLRTLAG